MRALVEAAADRLSEAGIDTARADAEWLLAGLLGVGRAQLSLGLDAPVATLVAARYEAAVARRAAREPLQRILGWEGFRGLAIALTDDVLVPRPETEVLVQWLIEMLPPPGPRSLTIADVGTGSGCIACAVAHERRDVTVLALDCSPVALAVARSNAAALGLTPRVRLAAGDLLECVASRSLDGIVANLPYLPTALLRDLSPEVGRHEPRLALDGGPDGLDPIRRLAADALRTLRPRGVLALETAGDDQATKVAAALVAAGYRRVETRPDLAGVGRFVVARGADGASEGGA